MVAQAFGEAVLIGAPGDADGAGVVHVSDPENPVEIGFFDTTPWSEGLFIVKPREQRLMP